MKGPTAIMERLSLEEILGKGEGQTLEFKKSLSLRREGLKALCAMVNSDVARGTVAFGIKPDGITFEIEHGNLDTAQRSLSQFIRNKFAPPLVVQMETKELNGKMVLIITAERYQGIPYHKYDGRAWIREGSVNRLLSLAKKNLSQEKETGISIQDRGDAIGVGLGLECCIVLSIRAKE